MFVVSCLSFAVCCECVACRLLLFLCARCRLLLCIVCLLLVGGWLIVAGCC